MQCDFPPYQFHSFPDAVNLMVSHKKNIHTRHKYKYIYVIKTIVTFVYLFESNYISFITYDGFFFWFVVHHFAHFFFCSRFFFLVQIHIIVVSSSIVLLASFVFGCHYASEQYFCTFFLYILLHNNNNAHISTTLRNYVIHIWVMRRMASACLVLWSK